MLALAVLSLHSPAPSFVDDFSDGPHRQAWLGSLNGGSLRPSGHITAFVPRENSVESPYLITKPGLIPADGDTVVTIDFTVLRISQNGVGISIRDSVSNQDALRVHVDAEQGTVQLWRGNVEGMKVVRKGWEGEIYKFRIPENGEVIRYQVRKFGSNWQWKINETELVEVTLPRKEYSVRLGQDRPFVNSPGPWTLLGYGPLRVDYVKSTKPVWLK